MEQHHQNFILEEKYIHVYDRLIDTENRLMIDRGEGGLGDGVKKVKGLSSTNW